MFAKPPSSYLGILDAYMCMCVDLACMAVVLEEENYSYKESKDTAAEESLAIDQVLKRYRDQVNGR